MYTSIYRHALKDVHVDELLSKNNVSMHALYETVRLF